MAAAKAKTAFLMADKDRLEVEVKSLATFEMVADEKRERRVVGVVVVLEWIFCVVDVSLNEIGLVTIAVGLIV